MQKSKKGATTNVASVSLAVASQLPEASVSGLLNPRDCGIAWAGVTASRTAIAMRMAKVTPGFPNNISEKVEREFKRGYYIAKDVSVSAPRYARIEGKYVLLKDGQGAPEDASVIHLTATFVTDYNTRDYKDAPELDKAIMALRKRYMTDAADQLRDLIALYKKAKAGTPKKKRGGKAKLMAERLPKVLAELVKSAVSGFDKRGDVSLPRDATLAILNRAFNDLVALANKK